MSLRRKMGLQIAAMLVGLLLVSAAALWGLNGLHTDYGLALEAYDQLRMTYAMASHLTTAQAMLQPGHVDRPLALYEVQRAANQCNLMKCGMGMPATAKLKPDHRCLLGIQGALNDAIEELSTPADNKEPEDLLSADNHAIGEAMAQVRTLSSHIHQAIKSHQDAAEAKRRATVTALAVVFAFVLIGGVSLGILQYRGVVRPLRGLSRGAKRIAAGQFTERIPERGGDELASLAHDFNRMAHELDGFYHQLEEKVAQKSKELILSERLASVGYLAAGVAHEINNPLGIIAGYAEYSLEDLKRKAAVGGGVLDETDADLIKSLQVISEEAFRCKDITGKLLSLARRGDESRQPVCLAGVASKVVSIVGGLRDYRERKLVVAVEQQVGRVSSNGSGQDDLTVIAVEAEMKQVVLNLTLNALEATPPDGGEVRIGLARENGTVELTVSDNGRGMCPQTLERVFEPFFTEKRGARQAGTGLGLSITHRIIESHGGTICAHSDGPGKGSRFVVRLPALVAQEVHA